MDKKIQILIVDNEITLSSQISSQLNQIKYQLIGTVPNLKEALHFLRKQAVDIILIELKTPLENNWLKLGLEIKNSFNLPFIIMASESNQSSINKAIKLNPTAILLKPLIKQQIEIAIDIAVENFHKPIFKIEKLNKSLGKKTNMMSLKNCLFLKRNNLLERVDFDDILWLKAESNYTIIHTLKGEFIYATVLKIFEEKLPTDQFMRVHRSYIINLEKIDGFEGKMVIIKNKYIPITNRARIKVFDMLQVV